MSTVTDKNTAFIFIGTVETACIEAYIEDITQKACAEVNPKKTTYCTNIPINKNGKRQPSCYVWWDDASVLDYILDNFKKGKVISEDKSYVIEINRCEIEIPEDVSTNVITTTWPLPSWINENDLKHIFSRFNVSQYFSCKIVKKRNGRYPFITFDRSSYDALFALSLKKVVHVRKQDDSATLLFYLEQRR